MNDKLIKVNLSKIDNFREHPFLANNDSSLMELVKSIKENGLLNPMVVREKENERYELISGHRRKKTLEILGIQEIKVVLKELNDDEATIFMVDSNIYRERVLPSEKAFAYKMKMDAIKHQGKSLGTKYPKLRSSEVMAQNNSDGEKTIRNYIRLTYLIPELLKLVDETVLKINKNGLTMGIKPAVELSYLGFAEQKLVLGVIEYCLVTPSHAQAIKIKKIAKDKKIDFDILEGILNEKKGNQNDKISFNKEKIENVLPPEIKQRDKRYVEQYIINAIMEYNKLNKSEEENIIVQDLVF